MAEIGSCADGSLGNQLKLIEHCARAGVSAVKLQDHRGEKAKGDPPWFPAKLETREEYLRRTSFDRHAWQLIRATATACEVELIVSPFSTAAVGLLEEVPVDGYKVASGQVTNIEMLKAIRETGRPIFLSSGMTTWEELKRARGVLGDSNVTILSCSSEYPCAPESVGLNWLAELRELFPGDPIGLSDHTLGMAASIAAVTLGAVAIERHVTFSRQMFGTDARNSLTIDELSVLVKEIRELDRMLASAPSKDDFVASAKVQKMREVFLEEA